GGAADGRREQGQQQNRRQSEDGGDAAKRPLVERRQRGLGAQTRRWERQVVKRGTVMIVGVVAVFAALEERAELDGLVGLVMMHWPYVEPREAKRQADGQCDHEEGAPAPAGHFGRP